jgi:hypothetical protein
MSKNSSLSTSTLTPRSLAAPIPTTDVRGHVLKQRGIVTKQIGDSSQPLRQGCEDLTVQRSQKLSANGDGSRAATSWPMRGRAAVFC